MEPVYIDSTYIAIYPIGGGGPQLQLQDYNVGSISVSSGITGNSVLDRVASSSTCKFKLLDRDKILKPEYATYNSWFRKGAFILCSFKFLDSGHTKQKFVAGLITDISYANYSDNLRYVDVTMSDWIDLYAKTPIISLNVQANKRADEGIYPLVYYNGYPPVNVTLNHGADTFSTIFDTVKSQTTLLSEISKLTMSEFGYFYLKNAADYYGIVFEGRNFRNTVQLKNVHNYTYNTYITSDGDTWVTDDGYNYGDADIYPVTMDFSTNTKIAFGESLKNIIKVKSYPRTIDISLQVLSQLDKPILLQPGEEKKNLVIDYINPSVKSEKINGTNLQTPTETTDYLMYSNENGTGTNLTPNLSVTAVYNSSNVTYTSIKNNGASAGYVTKLNSRGYGIYLYNPTEIIKEDSTSKSKYGYYELSLDQKYQDNPYFSEDLANTLLAQNKEPKTDIISVSGCANESKDAMLAFFYYDVGDKVYIIDALNNIEGSFFIQNVNYTLDENGILDFTWGLVPALTTTSANAWILETAGHSELDLTTILG